MKLFQFACAPSLNEKLFLPRLCSILFHGQYHCQAVQFEILMFQFDHEHDSPHQPMYHVEHLAFEPLQMKLPLLLAREAPHFHVFADFSVIVRLLFEH